MFKENELSGNQAGILLLKKKKKQGKKKRTKKWRGKTTFFFSESSDILQYGPYYEDYPVICDVNIKGNIKKKIVIEGPGTLPKPKLNQKNHV